MTLSKAMEDILVFWHRIEFFIPFDLDGRLKDQDGHKCYLRQTGDTSPILCNTPPEGKVVAGYTLYLGVFDKRDIVDVVESATAEDDLQRMEDEQRTELEGRTCMASLRLDPLGAPLFETLEVSTLPWAIGTVATTGLHTLNVNAFNAARVKLADDLHNFSIDRKTVNAELSPVELDQLVELLCRWAHYKPGAGNPVAAVDVWFKDEPRNAEAVQTELPVAQAEEEEEEDAEPEALQIGILNSFYIEDIEQTIVAARAGNVPDSLRRYLIGLSPDDARLDLDTVDGQRRVIEELAPGRVNRGRWPTDPTHAMSLMQQFAINSIRDRLQLSGLASVNGPPGTGKTTLLRDIIADTIVARAQVLAGLAVPQDAFANKSTLQHDGNSITLSHLIPELTGFEMVVASSNNAAVENISRDLPKRASVHAKPEPSYLQRVAHKVAAQRKGGSCRKLSEKDMPWGLIACTLGRMQNRRAFARALLGSSIRKDARKSWAGEERPLNLWEWRDAVVVPTFDAAVMTFRAAEQAVDALLPRLSTLADLLHRLEGTSLDQWCADAAAQVAHWRTKVQECEQEADGLRAEIGTVKDRIADLREEERLLDRQTPSWWQRMVNSAVSQAHRQKVLVNSHLQLQMDAHLRELSSALTNRLIPALMESHSKLAAAEQHQMQAAAEWHQLCQHRDQLRAEFKEISLPDSATTLNADDIQIAGLWHLPELAERRSALFQAALGLHEAWLAEVSRQGGGFGGNLVACDRLLSSGRIGDNSLCKEVWQSLFMVVPVVSTTFASFARQFRGLGPESLGWLFIDEAGQAVPQAAVGALFRARRAVVIGDPLQIEPVFTLPKRLITRLASLSPTTCDGIYSPDATSVQVLADMANPLGCRLQGPGGTPIWVGSPLRVHRRCRDPMFSLANRIAYDGKMVYGLGERRPAGDAAPYFGESAWIDIGGTVEGRQTVFEQIDFVAALLVDSYAKFNQLPNLYVISPFKEVKNALIREMRRPERWCNAEAPTDSLLDRWLEARVGTVHTFQGKEEDIVIMILGTDAGTKGAAQWAASKPNLLNVALTRAKRQFYMVADHGLWREQKYFADVATDLPVLTPLQFKERLAADWAKME